MDIRIGDRNPFTRMRHIAEPVVVILVVRQVRRQVAVVNPYVTALLDGDGVAVGRKHLGNLHVSHDHVGLALDGEADASQCYIPVRTRISR